MRNLIVVVIAAMLLGACASNKQRYAPKVLTTDPSDLSALNKVSINRQVALINAQQSSDELLIGSSGATSFYSSLRDMTEAVVVNAQRELARRQVGTNPAAPTALNISVTEVSSDTGLLNVEAQMSLEVVTGAALTKRIKVTNKTPGSVTRAYNGAVSLAVVEILSDPQLLGYLAGQ